MDKPKKQKKKIIEMPPYNDPMNKEGEIPTDVLGSYSGTPLDGSQPRTTCKKNPRKKVKAECVQHSALALGKEKIKMKKEVDNY